MRARGKKTLAKSTVGLDFFGKPFGDFLPSKPLRPMTLARPLPQKNLRASAFGFAEQALQLNGELGGRKNTLIRRHTAGFCTMSEKIRWINDLSELRAYHRAYSRKGARGVNFENAEKVYAIAQRIINISRQPQNRMVDWKMLATGDKGED